MDDALEAAKRKVFEKAQREIEELERAAAVFRAHGMMPTPIGVEVTRVDPEIGRVRRHKKGWPTTILEVLGNYPRGATRSELKAALADTHLGARLKETEAAFYGSIDKLKHRSAILEYDGRLFSPFLHKRHLQDVQAGRAPEAAPSVSLRSPAANAAVDFIKLHGPTESRRLVEILLETPGSGIDNRNSVYNLLARMIKKEQLVRVGQIYSLPSNENGEEAKASSPDADQGSNPDHNSRPSLRGA